MGSRAGEPAGHEGSWVGDQGLSPRGRGNLHNDEAAQCWEGLSARAGDGFPAPRRGSIPARAGEPITCPIAALISGFWGLSPRGPGEPTLLPAPGAHQGSRVYPRAGGGTRSQSGSRSSVVGLSPRGRGNRMMPAFFNRGIWSIPARAGEPGFLRASATMAWVYPRAGGGTELLRVNDLIAEGLSPRGRGNHLPSAALVIVLTLGSIPARAGEPAMVIGMVASPVGVYPRAGGGTLQSSACCALSVHGSIPARAGEPGSPTFDPDLDPRAGRGNHPDRPVVKGRVYPRAGGGTTSPASKHRWPRLGSIPARAGEPRSRTPPDHGSMRGRAGVPGVGLSPRGRGNRYLPGARPSRIQGSIPARAGEPPSAPCRTLGGRGSIPARAGEPPRWNGSRP